MRTERNNAHQSNNQTATDCNNITDCCHRCFPGPEDQTNSPKMVFQYMKAEYAIDNLLRLHLPVTSADKTNDLHEYLFAICMKDDPFGRKDEDLKIAKENIHRYVQEYAAVVQFVSFSETNNNQPLWAHYGDKHKGVCLGFTFDLEIDGDNLLRPVLYDAPVVDRIAEPGEVRTGEELHGLISRILRSKRPEWSYEREWRLEIPATYHRLEQSSTETKFFRVLKSELRQIIFGTRCHPIDIGRVSLVCLKNGMNVPFFRMDSDIESKTCEGKQRDVRTVYQMEPKLKLLSTSEMERFMNLALLSGCRI